MNQPLEKLWQLYAAMKQGSARADQFFNYLWPLAINLPKEEAGTLLKDVYAWAKENEEENPRVFGLATASLGMLNFHSGKYDECFTYYTAAQQLFEEQNDLDGVAICSIMLGNTYRTLGDLEHSIKSLTEGIRQLEFSGCYAFTCAIGHYNLAGIYAETGHYEKACYHFEQTLHCREVAYLRGMVLAGMAELYQHQKNMSSLKNTSTGHCRMHPIALLPNRGFLLILETGMLSRAACLKRSPTMKKHCGYVRI